MLTRIKNDPAEEIWKLLRETAKQAKETDARLDRQIAETKEFFAETKKLFAETDARLAKQFAETDARFAKQIAETKEFFAETKKQFAETDARLAKQFAETDACLAKQIAETDARLAKMFAETDKKINKVHGLFTSQWGRLIEAMVAPNAIKLFKERGIEVNDIYKRSKYKVGGRTMELDLLLENGNEVVVIEAKSTLRVSNVRDFLNKLEQFLDFCPRFRNYRIYGGVAGMDIVEEADIYADRRGLFVLNAVGDGIAHIKNNINFAPTDFGAKQIE